MDVNMIHLILETDFLIYSRHSIKLKNFETTSWKAAPFEPKKKTLSYLNFDKVIFYFKCFPNYFLHSYTAWTVQWTIRIAVKCLHEEMQNILLSCIHNELLNSLCTQAIRFLF